MEAINNHAEFPVLSPRMAAPSRGPQLRLAVVQLVFEGEGLVGPKVASSQALGTPFTASGPSRPHSLTFPSASSNFMGSQHRGRPLFSRLLQKLAM